MCHMEYREYIYFGIMVWCNDNATNAALTVTLTSVCQVFIGHYITHLNHFMYAMHTNILLIIYLYTNGLI